MVLDLREMFEYLTEMERVKGHHSAEGWAIRTFSRALQGWSSGSLSGADVLSVCHQAMEDWLKTKLKISAWSALTLPDMLPQAVEMDLLTRSEAVRLQHLDNLRARLPLEVASTVEVETALECCIQIVEKHW